MQLMHPMHTHRTFNHLLILLVLATIVLAEIGYIGAQAGRVFATPYTSPILSSGLSLEVIGDSISVGLYATQRSASFPRLLASAIHGPLVSGYSKSGIDSPQMYAWLRQHTLARANIVIVEIGTNDSSADFSRFQTDYPLMVPLIMSYNSGAILVCLGPWQPKTAFEETIATTIQTVCSTNGGLYVSLFALYANNAYHGPANTPTWAGPSNWFHPNNAGHRAIAQAIEQALDA